MNEVIRPYSVEEINAILRLVTELVVLIFATSVGTFSREMIFPDDNKFKQNVGLTLLASFIAFGITLKFEEHMTLPRTFLLCVGLGFFTPAFKEWFRDKKIFKIVGKIIKSTSDVTSSIVDEVSDEIDKE